MMARKSFIDILGDYGFNHTDEYKRLQDLLYRASIRMGGQEIHIIDLFAKYFQYFPRSLTSTCVNLSDFNNTYNFSFNGYARDKSFDDYLTFCEYAYNFAYYLCHSSQANIYGVEKSACEYVLEQVCTSVEKCSHQITRDSDKYIFIITPKDAVLNLVAGIVAEPIAFRLIEYNHRSFKHNLEKKREILRSMASDLEPKRSSLKSVAPSLEESLFFLFNNIGIRHNNDANKKVINNMSDEELGSLYDDTFQLCMQGYLQLDNQLVLDRVSALRLSLKSKK